MKIVARPELPSPGCLLVTPTKLGEFTAARAGYVFDLRSSCVEWVEDGASVTLLKIDRMLPHETLRYGVNVNLEGSLESHTVCLALAPNGFSGPKR
ncbi:MAG: hypothetical protein NTU62_13265 [Spirochaetes bacterium]|nr:hypothetical protein [Spirochaetota bacterium]